MYFESSPVLESRATRYFIVYKDGSSTYADHLPLRKDMRDIKKLVPIDVVQMKRRERG